METGRFGRRRPVVDWGQAVDFFQVSKDVHKSGRHWTNRRPRRPDVDNSPLFPSPGEGPRGDHDSVPLCQQPPVNRVDQPKNYFHLHMISDSTGETLIAAGRAAAAQFQDAQALEHVYPLIRTPRQMAAVVQAIDDAPGIVLYTIVDPDLSRIVDEACTEMGLPCISVLEPVMAAFQSYLGAPSKRRVGAQHVMNEGYFRRIEALNFTMDHDDGQLPGDYEEADVVLVGISRTSKTPTSIYLANRGIRTANIPVVCDVPLPPEIVALQKPLVVGLVATADRIAEVRRHRILGTTAGYSGEQYIDRSMIAEELKYARALCARHGWPLIDVTRRSIEETAAAVLALRPKQR